MAKYPLCSIQLPHPDETMRLLEFKQLRPEKGVPYCRDHLRRLIIGGRFPRPVHVSERRICWIEGEVDAWIESRLRARDAEPE